MESIEVCAHRNVHNRTRAEIDKVGEGGREGGRYVSGHH